MSRSLSRGNPVTFKHLRASKNLPLEMAIYMLQLRGGIVSLMGLLEGTGVERRLDDSVIYKIAGLAGAQPPERN